MITSADVRDYMDGLLREMQEAHKGWVCLDARGAILDGKTPVITWQCYAEGTKHSPEFERAEDCIDWFKNDHAENVAALKQKANELQTEAERLLRKAQELEKATKAPH